MISQSAKAKLRVVAQKADPNVKFSKSPYGGFQATVIYVLDDGQELIAATSTRLKRDLEKKLAKLPIENVTGNMQVEIINGQIISTSFELFAYNGI